MAGPQSSYPRLGSGIWCFIGLCEALLHVATAVWDPHTSADHLWYRHLPRAVKVLTPISDLPSLQVTLSKIMDLNQSLPFSAK